MSQAAAMAQFHADAMDAFRDVGIADAATYLAPVEDAEAVACEAYVDRNVETVDEFGRLMRFAYVIGLLKSDLVAVPKGVVTVGAESFRLDVIAPGSDEALTRWVATKI